MSYLYAMKRRAVFILLCLLPAVLMAQEIPSWKITRLEEYIRSAKEPVLVINFWATFCKPCVAEIPNFISVTEQKGSDSVRLLLVSLDLPSSYPGKISSFAGKQGWKVSLAWLNETNADYFCPRIDPSWSGSIPATLFVNTRTGYRHFVEEEIDARRLEQELGKALSGHR